MMKATAKAPANIALIKYWGKEDEELRLPFSSSISMNLSNCFTVTTVEFSPKYKKDSFFIQDSLEPTKTCPIGHNLVKGEGRVRRQLDRIRRLAKISLKAKVISANSFPVSAGIASSASGFAALSLAATKAAGISLSEKELSILTRLASGSACRSIPDGFVFWQKGRTSEDSYAYSLYPPDYWDLRDIIAIVAQEEKKIGSTAGMKKAFTSPFFQARLKGVGERIKKIKKALKEKDFKLLGETIEKEAINLHAVMMTQRPPLFYWNEITIKIILAVYQWRDQGLPVYFTLDAGANVHLFCQGKDEKEAIKRIKKIKGVLDVIINKSAKGARLIRKHLF